MDINSIKARLQALSNRSKKANDIWKPRDEHAVRLLPYPHGTDPFLELAFHYDIGEQSVLCPKVNFGNECAICDFCDALKSWKNPDGNDKPERDRKTDWELFKKIQAKVRVFVPMVERGKEGDGPKFWGVTPNQAVQILEICNDGDRLSEVGEDPKNPKNALRVVIDADKAYDLTVKFAKPGEKGNTKSFAQVTIEGKIKATPLLADKKARQELISQVKNIREVYPEVTSEEANRIFQKFVNSGQAEAKAEGGVEYRPNTTETQKTGGRTVDEAFADILGEDA